jgi:hypothetical protein
MKNNPKSEKLTFFELINKYKKIEIPIIQRDYAQGREGKEELRKNFLTALHGAVKAVNSKPLELDFVYGSVKNNVLQPLDGQQRLTTLFLLHWFIAIKDNKLDDTIESNNGEKNTVRDLLKKFTYETRISSREFCEKLIEDGIDFTKLLETDYYEEDEAKPKNNELSKTIIDSSWFFLSWKKDPTIKSMLTMLDSIHQTFKNETEIWDKLNNITFHYIELENFGLSDDLYIKMNARGKLLTDFENFKAKFEQLIKQEKWEAEETDVRETFSHKIDTDWTDLFWNYRDENTNIFDDQFLNFFRTMATINYALNSCEEVDFNENINLLRSDNTISFNKYLELDCFDKIYFKTIKSVLNKITDENKELKNFFSDDVYIDEENIFEGVRNNDLPYADLVITFAFYKYLAIEENIDIKKLRSWLRIIRNLVEGSRPYFFNDAREFANAINSIYKLLDDRNSIVEYFKEKKQDEKFSLSGFLGEQVKEEITKANLILQSDDWKNAIIEIENHGYFNGQIGFLLDWCKDENGIYDLKKFKDYSKKAKAIFKEERDKEGLEQFDNFLFERALLATGNYLLKKGLNHSFLIDRERDISWKRLLRDNNSQRKILKQLVDKVSVSSLTNDLQKIIDNFSNQTDWRYYFIKQPEMIAACGSQKLIRFNNENDILLLGSTTTSGYHKEYYSYSLYVELKNNHPNIDIVYYDQRTVEEWKSFVFNGKEIAFEKGQYVCIKGSGETEPKRRSRKEVLDFLKL